jgi:enterochelin esterase-like enzyme
VSSAAPPGTPSTAAGTAPATVAPPPATAPPRTEPPPTPAPTEPPALTVETPAPTIVPPAGTPIPGGPLRTRFVPAPPDPGPCTETTGHVERLTFHSNVLLLNDPEQRFRVYLPACYRWNTTTRYPTLYLLHGAQVDESQWEDVGIFRTADRLIASRAIPPMIIVLPDAIWTMGSYQYEPPLMDRLMLGEMLPTIDQDLRTIATPGTRAIGGISRGGEWALIVGARHPELFGAIGGHSPAVGLPSTPNPVLVPLFTRRTSPQKVRLDVGTSDSLLGNVAAFDQGLTAAGVAHELHTGPGGHDRAYWGGQSEAYLRFYASLWAPATPQTGSPTVGSDR